MPDVKTNEVQFNYLYWAEPNKDGKYSAQIVIPKTDTDTVGRIQSAIESVAKENGFTVKVLPAGNTLVDKNGKQARYPLRDGDAEGKAGCEDSYFINVNKTKRAPSIVIGPERQEPISSDEFMSTDYGRALISFYWYNHAQSGSRGVGAGFEAAQMTRKGSREFGGGASASVFDDDFEFATATDEDWMS